MDRPFLKIFISIVLIIVIFVLSYVGYVFFSYERIPDNVEMEINSIGEEDTVIIGQEYSAVSQNIGFGAYNQEFSFFMDGGTESVAETAATVIENITAATDMIKILNPDFLLLQEVDIDSTRSYHIDQYSMLSESSGVNWHYA
jgi:hypothetical protein